MSQKNIVLQKLYKIFIWLSPKLNLQAF